MTMMRYTVDVVVTQARNDVETSMQQWLARWLGEPGVISGGMSFHPDPWGLERDEADDGN